MNVRYILGCVLVHSLPVYAGVIYVNASATGANDGTSWSHARTSLSAAIDSAGAGDEVWVAEGAYRPIALKSGVKVYGGFMGTETAASASAPELHRTYISGAGSQRVVTSVGNDASTVLRGFTIKDGLLLQPDQAGGGLYLNNSSATIVECDFTNNSARFAGGAVANYHGGSPTFINCRFFANGGANGNTTPVGGGAVFNHDGSPSFVNSVFHGNKAGDGGAVVSLRGSVEFLNCTFSNNEATKRHGGALFDNTGRAVVRNCIIWNNRAASGEASEIYNHPRDGGTTDVAFSDVKGGWPGMGNIASDPLFANATANDFRLQSASPCADLGRRSSLPPDLADLDWDGDTTEPLPTDLSLHTRSTGTSVDAGAYRRISP